MKQPKRGDLFLKPLLPVLGSFLGSFLSHHLFRELPRKLLRDYLENFLALCLQSLVDDGLANRSWICHVRDTTLGMVEALVCGLEGGGDNGG